MLPQQPRRNSRVENLVEQFTVRRTNRQTDRQRCGFAFVPTMQRLHSSMVNVNGTHRQSFAADSLPPSIQPSQPALLAGPALFARFRDDRTFNVRAQTISGRARTSNAPELAFVGRVLFIFSTMGTIHRRDRIRTFANPPFRHLFLISMHKVMFFALYCSLYKKLDKKY